MSKYHNAFQGFVKLFTGAKQPGVKGSSTTIIGVAPSKNIKKFQEQKEKIIKATDAYKKKVNDPEVKKKMNEGTSKTLGKISQILKGKKVEKKAMGGRIGYKSGNKDGVGRDHGGTTLKLKNKKFFMLGDSKKDQKKYYDMSRAGARDMNKTGQGEKFRDATTVDEKTGQIKIKRDEKKAMGGRIGRKLGGGTDMAKRKTNVQKIKETFAPKKPGNVPSKFKGFSKLPEAVQQKMNKKLARKV